MDSRLVTRPKALPKNVLLKDYLLDDFSSCSSNGFKSFPRRQCCTSMRFLIQAELKKKQNILPQQNSKYLNFSPKKLPATKSSALSAFQNVITAVKRLPFTGSASNPEKKKSKSSFLARSFSRKILKKSFWKRKSSGNKEIPRWTSFNQWLRDEPEPDSVDSSESKSDRSLGSEFTEFSSGNSAPEVNLNLPEEGKEAKKAEKEDVSSTIVVVSNDDVSTGGSSSTTGSEGGAASTNCSSTDTKNKPCPSDEKEQFSPVSVLDCPFHDEDDEVSSPFRHRLAHMEGSKNKLMKKIQRFESLAQLEPVNLSKRFATLPECDKETIVPPLSPSSASIDEKFISDIEDDDAEQEQDDGYQVEQKAVELLDQLKETMPSYGLKLKADRLLLDFFREKIVDSKKQRGEYSFDEEVIEEGERWINERKHDGLLVDWEVQKNRHTYIRDMEQGGEWKALDKDNEELALELEVEVFEALLDDLLLDIS